MIRVTLNLVRSLTYLPPPLPLPSSLLTTTTTKTSTTNQLECLWIHDVELSKMTAHLLVKWKWNDLWAFPGEAHPSVKFPQCLHVDECKRTTEYNIAIKRFDKLHIVMSPTNGIKPQMRAYDDDEYTHIPCYKN